MESTIKDQLREIVKQRNIKYIEYTIEIETKQDQIQRRNWTAPLIIIESHWYDPLQIIKEYPRFEKKSLKST